jgi:hypothetical protein
VKWPRLEDRRKLVDTIEKAGFRGLWGTMRNDHILTATLLLLLSTQLAVSQSLGEVAKREEERRKTIEKPSKVYTNENLKRDAGTSVQAAGPTHTAAPQSTGTTPASGASSATTPPAAAGVTQPQTQGKDEKYWKSRINEVRDQMSRHKTLVDALQSRVNALDFDRTSTDDPAKRAQIERDRQKALAEMERLKKEMKEQDKAIAAIEEEARRANVPPGWLR